MGIIEIFQCLRQQELPRSPQQPCQSLKPPRCIPNSCKRQLNEILMLLEWGPRLQAFLPFSPRKEQCPYKFVAFIETITARGSSDDLVLECHFGAALPDCPK